ncbi:MAG: universal stress protein [Pacificimonas sp.]|jgi:nucleotide-binding universal stress UspA family protein|nr:universal stress protein [Pacificimonas sp.]
MRRIIVHAFDDKGFETRLEAAMAFARTFDADLTLMHVKPSLMTVGDSYAVGMFSGVDLSGSEERLAANEAKFRETAERLLAGEDVTHDWVVRDGVPEREFAAEGVLADLMVLSPLADDFSGQAGDTFVGRMIAAATCPVLVPVSASPACLNEGRILILWNGSDEAGRAVIRALPVIDRASEVRILTIGEPKAGRPDAERVAEYLSRGGTKAETLDVEESGKIGDQVLEEAGAFNADLIVMGAYGRGRLTELVLGGATQSMIRQRQFPVFFGH